jgi:hypothetical protein
VQFREVEFLGNSLIYAQITLNFGMRFRQISIIFRDFLEDLPFGEHTKDDDQKISSCLQVSREFHRKKEGIFHKKRCFGEKLVDLTIKRREKFVANFCIFEKMRDFFRF